LPRSIGSMAKTPTRLMGRPLRSVEDWLAAVRQLPASELGEAVRVKRAGAGIVIAAAARRAAAEHEAALAPELVRAFARLLDDAKKTDPGCRGKIAIARALHELDVWDDAVFVVGLRVVQHENQEDTAAELRGVCGLAHAHFGRADALAVLAELLADRERTARIAAAQGIGDVGVVAGAALVRYKLLVGDDEPEVLAACFASLFDLERDAAIDFAIRALENHGELAEAAALALGGARAIAAVAPLVAWCEAARPEQRARVGYLALALVRADAANAHLLDKISTGHRSDALAAAKALATFIDDPAIAAALRAAIAATPSALRRELAHIVGHGS
jgi:hypothetical protein